MKAPGTPGTEVAHRHAFRGFVHKFKIGLDILNACWKCLLSGTLSTVNAF